MGRWGVLDISPNPIIKSIITHFLSITSPENLFSGDTVRASIEYIDVVVNLEKFGIIQSNSVN